MKYTAALLLFVLATFSPLVSADEAAITIEVKVPAIKCAGCSWAVSEQLKKLDHTYAVYVDVKTKAAIIEVKSLELPGREAVLNAVKATGYTGEAYKELDETFASAKARLEK